MIESAVYILSTSLGWQNLRIKKRDHEVELNAVWDDRTWTGTSQAFDFLPALPVHVSPRGEARFTLSASLFSAGRPGCRWRRPEYLLRGIGDVEEAVCVPVVRINLPHAGRHAGHAFLSHQEEQRLGGVQCNLISERREIEIEKESFLKKYLRLVKVYTKIAFSRERPQSWQRNSWNKKMCFHLSRHINWPSVSSKGTRNFVLSNSGRLFSRM